MSDYPDLGDCTSHFQQDGPCYHLNPHGNSPQNQLAASQSVLPESLESILMDSNGLTNNLSTVTSVQAGLSNDPLSGEEGETIDFEGDIPKHCWNSSMYVGGEEEDKHNAAASMQLETAMTSTRNPLQEQSSLVGTDDGPASDKNLRGTYAHFMTNSKCHRCEQDFQKPCPFSIVFPLCLEKQQRQELLGTRKSHFCFTVIQRRLAMFHVWQRWRLIQLYKGTCLMWKRVTEILPVSANQIGPNKLTIVFANMLLTHVYTVGQQFTQHCKSEKEGYWYHSHHLNLEDLAVEDLAVQSRWIPGHESKGSEEL